MEKLFTIQVYKNHKGPVGSPKNSRGYEKTIVCRFRNQDMLGFSKRTLIIFALEKKIISSVIEPKVGVLSSFVRMNEVTPEQWQNITALQGKFNVSYLKYRYKSPNTFLLLGYVGNKLAHVGWVVPSEKIIKRYPFVTSGSYTLIACRTAVEFRGLGIYSSQIQKAVRSDLPAALYWIWADNNNIASLRGIQKAGAVEKGRAVRTKWIYGLFSRVVFSPIKA